MFLLRVREPGRDETVVPMRGDQLTIGRSPSCRLSFPQQKALSRNHAHFVRDGRQEFALAFGAGVVGHGVVTEANVHEGVFAVESLDAFARTKISNPPPIILNLLAEYSKPSET